jgi:hypothetical protein
VAACATRSAADTLPAIIGHIVTRDHEVAMSAGDACQYTVRTRDGRVLAERVTARQLQTRFPDLHRVLNTGYAQWAGL